MAPTHHSSLQIPQIDPEMPSSRQGNSHNAQGQSHSSSQYRPASVAVHSATPSSPNPHSASSAPRRQQRASHSVVTNSASAQDRGNAQSQTQQEGPDVYSHPAAVAYASAHPRRPIPRFGPYLLLQTLGEGEFGKVKLGLHVQWGEEVAVKLIRRGNIDSTVRMSKVEREIEVLRVRHTVSKRYPCLMFSLGLETPQYRSSVRRDRNGQVHRHYPRIRFRR